MSTATASPAPRTARELIRFLETGEPTDLFAPDIFSEINFPHLRMQETTADALIALRRSEHPGLTEVRVERLDPTARGWVLQLAERWDRGGTQWYSRELFRADVEDGRIVELAVYCTGDWDEVTQREHAAKALVRP